MRLTIIIIIIVIRIMIIIICEEIPDTMVMLPVIPMWYSQLYASELGAV